MNHSVSLSDDGRLVCCRVTDDITFERATQFTRDAIALGERRGVHCFLFDLRGTRNVASVFGNYQFAYSGLATVGMDRCARVAMLVDADDHSHDFVETAVRNAGYDVKLFTEAAAATAWLTASAPCPPRPLAAASSPTRRGT